MPQTRAQFRKSVEGEEPSSSSSSVPAPSVVPAEPIAIQTTLADKIRGYFVHILTASTTITHLLFFQALHEGKPQEALLWNLLAVVIDALDGTLARKFKVKQHLPYIDGALMDNLVDFITFVLCPCIFFIRQGMLPSGFELVFAALPLLSSAFGFSRDDAKLVPAATSEFPQKLAFFTGFPSYWNVLPPYFLFLNTTPIVNAIVISVLAILVFYPFRYIYITRFEPLQKLHYLGAYSWGGLLVAALLTTDGTRQMFAALSLVYPIFYLVHSFIWHFRLEAAAKKQIKHE